MEDYRGRAASPSVIIQFLHYNLLQPAPLGLHWSADVISYVCFLICASLKTFVLESLMAPIGLSVL